MGVAYIGGKDDAASCSVRREFGNGGQMFCGVVRLENYGELGASKESQ